MALTIETGAGVSGATSYVTLAQARAYASARGLSLSAVDATLEALLIKAVDYLESKRDLYKGDKLYGSGYLQWPRSDAWLDGFEIEDTTIPAELKNAQCQLAVELSTIDVNPTVIDPQVRRQRVEGAVEIEYAVSDDSGAVTPRMPKVDALLSPLFRSGGSMCLTVERA